MACEIIPRIGTVAMTRGELRLAERLETRLDADYRVWFGVTAAAPHRLPRHPDFLLLHARRGLLALEVKDWKIEQLRPGATLREFHLDFGGGPVVKANPLAQCRDTLLPLVDKLKRDPQLAFPPPHPRAGQGVCAWNYGVVFPFITRAQFDAAGLAEVISAHRALCADEMTERIEPEAFQRRLWEMCDVPQRPPLTAPQLERIRWHIFPDLRLPAPGQLALPIDDPAPDIVRMLDLQQEQLARGLGEGHRVVHGAAGSGKTALLVFRSLHLARLMSKPVLVLCFNKPIADRLRATVAARGADPARVHVHHFHHWCGEQLRTYEARLPAADGDPGSHFDALVQGVVRGVQAGRIPRAQYGSVLIDEAHDFHDDWLRLAVQMVDPDSNSLLVMYDDAQSIYRRAGRRFSFAGVGIQARGRTTVLRLNYRNTAQIVALARAFAEELLAAHDCDDDGVPVVAPESCGRQGPWPLLRRLADSAAERRFIAGELRRLHTEKGLPWSSMAVLGRDRHALERAAHALREAGVPLQSGAETGNRLRPDEDTVTLLTMHAAKGLEFQVVVLPELCRMPHPEADTLEEARVLYVAMTRATDRLILTHHGQSGFTRRLAAVAHSLRAVAED